MFDYSKDFIVNEARKKNFNVNTYEKVLRLCDVLQFISECPYSNMLSLKGGTAINLWILDLPRLSVDADFDFSLNCSREEMLRLREEITKVINEYMAKNHYILSNKSKYTFSLDSLVYKYETITGSNDLLKVEINYSNRIHVFDTTISDMKAVIGKNMKINRLVDEEIIGSKMNALISRDATRDVYDIYNMFNRSCVSEDLVKKVMIFYYAISSDAPIKILETIENVITRINALNYNKLRETLIPLLRKGEKINIEEMKSFVISLLERIAKLDDSEKAFINKFNSGLFEQELLFENYKVNDLNEHPMLKWKMSNDKRMLIQE